MFAVGNSHMVTGGECPTLQVTGNVWRFESTEGDSAMFTTRNAIHLNFVKIDSFVKWKVEDHYCSVVNDSLPQTDFHCSIQGVIKVSALSTSGRLLTKHLQLSHSLDCFHWYVYKTKGIDMFYFNDMELLVWIVDMRYANEDEKLNRASAPSNYSRALTEQFHTLGQLPNIRPIMEQNVKVDTRNIISVKFDKDRCIWNVSTHTSGFRQPKILITGRSIPLFDCMIRSTYAVLPCNLPSMTTGPNGQIIGHSTVTQGTMLRLRANVTNPVLVKGQCTETTAVLLTSDGIYMTWDNFISSEPLYIPANETLDGVLVESAAFMHTYLVVLIKSTLYYMSRHTRTWLSVQGDRSKGDGGKVMGAKEKGAKEMAGKMTGMKKGDWSEEKGKEGIRSEGDNQETGRKGVTLMGEKKMDNMLPGDMTAGQNMTKGI
ncbi:hypothetical protein LSAT2_013335 [Lamellibrachia satsuma]|nr:hypothetical protein LSAT2_013335 [Lamellibrachia satsuma]